MKPNVSSYELPYKLEYIGYNFGLAKMETAQKSSGIVWSKCIDDLTAGKKGYTVTAMQQLRCVFQ